ncbi:MAG TPA: DNA translocase FtsK, partial [Clostridia bacterium]|nr:DNA translocase FtsK [Clostridia bacterium]
KIKNLSEDIALNLASPGIRIEQIPGKAAIGVEVPNDAVRVVSLREIIDSKAFRNHRSNTAFCLGCDITGEPVVADIARMPHLLIAGATGSGKSVCINSLIMSLIYKASPDDVKLILIDPKVVELGIYNGIPHLMIPVVTQTKKAAGALSWAVQEMEKRYTMFAEKGVRDIAGYNRQAKAEGEDKLPKIVIIIDELADLMLAARDSVEDAICRIAQKARACGIHLVVATQRPSVDVITGLIKANIPSRIAFKVASQVDSRIILDNAGGAGADKLLGRGDMLFLPVGSIKPIRVQGAFVSDAEVEAVVDYLKKSCEAEYDMEVVKEVENTQSAEGTRNTALEEDELLPQAVQIAIEMKQISASYLQRKLGIGYNRAARIIDQMEERGYISCKDGSNPRMVLIDKFPEELQGR